MAILTLTEEEKALALWRDLDDASLGRFLKKLMSVVQTSAQEREVALAVAASLHLVCQASAAGSDELEVRLEGVTEAGEPLGTWTVLAKRQATEQPS